MLLENKVAVIYGAGGAIGGAVARAFGREGARLFLAGRTQATLDTVAADIRASGGIPESIAADDPIREAVEKGTVEATQLGRAATLADVGNVAAFVASDLARTLTSTDINISAGAIVD